MDRILAFPKLEKQTLDRFTWLREVASASGPTSPKARLVAHTLGMRMNADMANCFPSQATIAIESGLSERAVRYALGELVAEGWLTVVKEKMKGRQWCRSRYLPTLPKLSTGNRTSVTQPLPDDRQDVPQVPANGAGSTGKICIDDRQGLPTTQTSYSDSYSDTYTTLKPIDKKAGDKMKREEAQAPKAPRPPAEPSEEVLREKIRKAAEVLGAEVSPEGIARITWIPKARIIELMRASV